MKVTIDKYSGFCAGVVNAIKIAEEELTKNPKLYCLGDIVHNGMEVNRLEKKGLIIINHDEFKKLKNCKVLFRAHGEPPETYKIAKKNNIDIIDTTCPVVLRLQKKIRQGYLEMKNNNGQIIIYGKKGHAEVNGLVGQANNEAIIINSESDLEKIDYSKPIQLYSQTTQSLTGYYKIKNIITKKCSDNANNIITNNSICKALSSREPLLKKFAAMHDVIIFVSGKKSSNGNYLFKICKSINNNTYFISNKEELKNDWFKNKTNVGICGATSTPMWLMKEVKNEIEKY